MKVIKRAYPEGKFIPQSALRSWMSGTQRQTVKRVHTRRVAPAPGRNAGAG